MSFRFKRNRILAVFADANKCKMPRLTDARGAYEGVVDRVSFRVYYPSGDINSAHADTKFDGRWGGRSKFDWTSECRRPPRRRGGQRVGTRTRGFDMKVPLR